MDQLIKASYANELLERPASEEYLAEWKSTLKQEKTGQEVYNESTVVIFKLCNEWLALSTFAFFKITDKRTIHRIPNRSNKILLGISNLRGQIVLCVALHELLELETTSQKMLENFNRFIAIKKDSEQWLFPVNEVFGIFRCDNKELHNVPVTVSKSKANFLKGVFTWENKNVGYLDEELLFSSLGRILSER